MKLSLSKVLSIAVLGLLTATANLAFAGGCDNVGFTIQNKTGDNINLSKLNVTNGEVAPNTEMVIPANNSITLRVYPNSSDVERMRVYYELAGKHLSKSPMQVQFTLSNGYLFCGHTQEMGNDSGAFKLKAHRPYLGLGNGIIYTLSAK